MTKTKRVSSLRHLLLMRILKSVFGLVLVGVCGYGAFMMAYLSIGRIQTSLDPALRPIAEDLYAHPLPTGETIRLEAQTVSPFKGLCYYTRHQREEGRETGLGGSRWTEVFLNGERVPPILFYEIGGGPLLSLTEPFVWRSHCLDGRGLSSGLHIMELHLRQNLGDAPIIHRWAVMVEE